MEIATHQRSFEVAHFSPPDSHWCDNTNEQKKQTVIEETYTFESLTQRTYAVPRDLYIHSS